jgi:hypothetical protein
LWYSVENVPKLTLSPARSSAGAVGDGSFLRAESLDPAKRLPVENTANPSAWIGTLRQAFHRRHVLDLRTVWPGCKLSDRYFQYRSGGGAVGWGFLSGRRTAHTKGKLIGRAGKCQDSRGGASLDFFWLRSFGSKANPRRLQLRPHSPVRSRACPWSQRGSRPVRIAPMR